MNKPMGKLILSVALLCASCLPDQDKSCSEARCTAGEAADGSAPECATQRGTRLLLDNFGVDPFRIVRVKTTDGRFVTPAVFEWRAQEKADVVVCALFAEPPQLSCDGITNFEEAAVLYDVRRFGADEAREGTFDLAAARSRGPRQKQSYWGVGCWAYNLVDVVGATVLMDVDNESVPDDMRLPETCGAGRAPCYDARARRPGTCRAGTCKPYCSTSMAALLACPKDMRCDVTAEADGEQDEVCEQSTPGTGGGGGGS